MDPRLYGLEARCLLHPGVLGRSEMLKEMLACPIVRGLCLFPARHPWEKNTTFPRRRKNGDGHRNEEEENWLAANKRNDDQHLSFTEETNSGGWATCGRRESKMASTVLWTSGKSIFSISDEVRSEDQILNWFAR